LTIDAVANFPDTGLVDVHRGSNLWTEVQERYDRCCVAIRNRDVDAFLEWTGPDGSFIREDGTIGHWADTRPFWEWRVSQMLDIGQFDIEVEAINIDEEGLLVVDFHEVSRLTVRDFDGATAVRFADLHNRNWWRRSETGWSIVNGAEPRTRRTLDGVPIDDLDDPIGFASWRRFSQGEDATHGAS